MSEQSPFTSLEASFRLLCTGPSPLAVHGRDVGPPFPRRPIPLTELGAILLHPSTPYEARDRAMRLVVRRAQRHGGAWTVGTAGVLLPGLRAAVASYVKAYPASAEDLEADVLVELVHSIAAFDTRTERVASRLLWRAAQRARRRLAREQAAVRTRAEVPASAEPHRPWGHPDFVLAEAVRDEVISAEDADLIGDTRLGGVSVRRVAARTRSLEGSVLKRRARAERRLVLWLTSEEVPSAVERRRRRDAPVAFPRAGAEVACREEPFAASFVGADRFSVGHDSRARPILRNPAADVSGR